MSNQSTTSSITSNTIINSSSTTSPSTTCEFLPTTKQQRWVKHFQNGFIGNVIQVLSITMALKAADNEGKLVRIYSVCLWKRCALTKHSNMFCSLITSLSWRNVILCLGLMISFPRPRIQNQQMMTRRPWKAVSSMSKA